MTKKLSLFLAFLAVLTIGIYFGEQIYFAHRPEPVLLKTVKVKDPPSTPVLRTDKLVTQPALTSSKAMVPSPDGSLFAVEPKPDELTILDAQNGHVVGKTGSNGSIQNVTWISNRLLFFMTTGNALFTYDVRNRQVRLIHSFQIPSGESFRTIAFSAYTNDIFVIFGNQSGNTVYQFDTNEHDYVRNIGHISITQAYYGSTNLTLYMEDSGHTLYQLKNGYIARLQKHAAILRGAGNELFYGLLNGKNQVVSVGVYDGQGKSHVVCRLPQPTPIDDVVVDHAGTVFIANSGTLVNVTHHHSWLVPAGFELKIARNDIVLTRGSEYKVVVN